MNKSLNSDDQQLHKHQQCEQSSLTSHKHIKNTTTCVIGNPDSGLGLAQQCDRVTPILWSQSSFLRIGSPTPVLI